MRENKPVKNSLIIAAVILVITASFFTINYVRTKKKMENFNAALGKDEELEFSQIIQTFLDEKELGTTEEKIQYESKKDLIEIKEKMFLAQVNDIYLNKEDYLGKTIKLEGIFKMEQGKGKPYCFVVRYGPGCCGYDSNVGFEVAWNKEKGKLYPNRDSWVEAIGELKTYEEDGYNEYLYIDLASLNVKDKRGTETIKQ